MLDKFNEAYMKIISEQSQESDNENQADFEWLKAHGFTPKEEDGSNGYSIVWVKKQGNFEIVVKKFIAWEGMVYYTGKIKNALLFLGGGWDQRHEVKTANDAVSKCAAFIGSLRNEIDNLKAW